MWEAEHYIVCHFFFVCKFFFRLSGLFLGRLLFNLIEKVLPLDGGKILFLSVTLFTAYGQIAFSAFSTPSNRHDVVHCCSLKADFFSAIIAHLFALNLGCPPI